MSTRDDILALLDRPVKTWRPDQDDPKKIAGVVVNVAVGNGSFGAFPIIELDDGSTVWRVFAFGTVFQREIGTQVEGNSVRTNVQAGDILGLHDDGERKHSQTLGRQDYRYVRVIHRPMGPRLTAPLATIDLENSEIPY